MPYPNCPNCNGELARMPGGSLGEFCPHCGENAHQLWLSENVEEIKVCPKKCELAELPQGALFCPGCGARLELKKKYPLNDPWNWESAPVFRAGDDDVPDRE